MPSFPIFFNQKKKQAFIVNKSKHCKKTKDLIIDVFEHCFKCQYFLGIVFGKKKLKIRCSNGLTTVAKGKEVNFIPSDFNELYELAPKPPEPEIVKKRKAIKAKKKKKKRKTPNYTVFERGNLCKEKIPVICSKCGEKITEVSFLFWYEALQQLAGSRCKNCDHRIENFKIVAEKINLTLKSGAL